MKAGLLTTLNNAEKSGRYIPSAFLERSNIMAKNIMNTSDKSNFILNMTDEQYSKVAVIGLIAACLSVSLFTALPEVSSKATYSFSAVGLAIPGVFCMITALISLIRKFIDRKMIFPACAFGTMIGWGIVSLLDSYDINIGFYGFPQRGEGLLAIIFYCSFFITAASIKRENALKAVTNGIILAGLLNSAAALLQLFIGQNSSIFIEYRHMGLDFRFAAYGLAQSPIFLAMTLTLSMTAALVSFVLNSEKKRRIFCIISASFFSFCMIYTFSLAGIAGMIFAVTAAATAGIIKKKLNTGSLLLIVPIFTAILAVVLCSAGVGTKNNSDKFKKYGLHDGRTLWTGDSFSRAESSGLYDGKAVDIDNTYDVYYLLNSKTIDIIKEYPITGTGPEQLIYPQIYTTGDLTGINEIIKINTGTFDKVYNEYLYTAATRGIPSLIALICIILPVLCIGCKNMKKSASPETAALFFTALGGILIFFIGCSNITFSPIFWTAAGASCVMTTKLEKEKSGGNNRKKSTS